MKNLGYTVHNLAHALEGLAQHVLGLSGGHHGNTRGAAQNSAQHDAPHKRHGTHISYLPKRPGALPPGAGPAPPGKAGAAAALPAAARRSGRRGFCRANPWQNWPHAVSGGTALRRRPGFSMPRAKARHSRRSFPKSSPRARSQRKNERSMPLHARRGSIFAALFPIKDCENVRQTIENGAKRWYTEHNRP